MLREAATILGWCRINAQADEQAEVDAVAKRRAQEMIDACEREREQRNAGRAAVDLVDAHRRAQG